MKTSASPLQMQVGRKIRAYRKQKEISLTALSEMTGIAASNLSSIELGKTSPTLSTLVKISNAFGVNASEFISVALYDPIIILKNRTHEDDGTSPEGPLLTNLLEEVFLKNINAMLLRFHGRERRPATIHGSCLIYCLAGSILLSSNSTKSNVLNQDDCAYISDQIAVQVRSNVPAKALIVSSKGIHTVI